MGGYGYNVYSSFSSINVLIDSVTLTYNAAANPSIRIGGATNRNITVSNSSMNTGTGIRIENTANLTISNISSTKGISLDSITTGTISNVTVPAGSTMTGFFATNSSALTISDFSYAGSDFLYYIKTSNQFTLNRVSATSGQGQLLILAHL